MAKPSVDGLEKDLQEQLDFARVNIRDTRGSKLAAKYNVRAVPTFLLIDRKGKLVYRKTGGSPDRAAISAKLAAMDPIPKR